MLQRTLFPIPKAVPAGPAHEPAPSCLERLHARGGIRVLTTEALSSRDIRELVEAARGGPIEVRFRIPTPDRRLAAALEPGRPPPSLRFASLRAARRAGLVCGVLVAPLVPGVNDPECDLARLFDEAARSGASFVECVVARAAESRDRRLVRSLRERYPRAAARLEVRRLTTHPGPGEDRARTEATLTKLAGVFGVALRGVSDPGRSARAPKPGQQRFSFAV